MQIQIHNPNALPTIDYRKVQPLQGNLKDLSDKNYNKLKNVLLKRGITVPLYLWLEQKNEKGKIIQNYWLLDGHQRQRVMLKEDVQPYHIPYILIEAENLKDAKEQLLEITSQYGTITQEGFDEFSADLSQDSLNNLSFDALTDFNRSTGNDEPKDEFKYVCPECNHENVKSAFMVKL